MIFEGGTSSIDSSSCHVPLYWTSGTSPCQRTAVKGESRGALFCKEKGRVDGAALGEGAATATLEDSPPQAASATRARRMRAVRRMAGVPARLRTVDT